MSNNNALSNYMNSSGLTSTPQTERLTKNQKKNNAGGFVYKIDNWKRLSRFLILGSEGGTYYVSESKLTTQNADNVLKCIKEDGKRVVDEAVKVSVNGLSPKNDLALFVLALVALNGDDSSKSYAYANLSKIARIPTHLFTFMKFMKQGNKGWGRAYKRAVQNWYLDKNNMELAYHVTKYQNREGMTHRDALRLSHPKTDDSVKNSIFNYVVKGNVPEGNDKSLQYLKAVNNVSNLSNNNLVSHIKEYKLPLEVIPTIQHTKEVYEAILENSPLTWTIRNLSTITRLGLLDNFDNLKKVVDKLTNPELVMKSRIHPMNVLVALRTYQQGYGIKNNWVVNQDIVAALNDLFYLSFKNVDTTNSRYLIGVDISGSMGSRISNMPITCAEASMALAMCIKHNEPFCKLMAFDYDFYELPINKNTQLESLLHNRWGGGATDCAKPMLYAIENNLDIDCFIVLTDNETWAGNIQPMEALRQYRKKTGINAKLIVIGMTSSRFTIADPEDSGSLDIAGFSSDIPALISNFVLDKI